MTRMVLGITHDTCPVCGKDIKMRTDRTLYHHGHPARRCLGMGKFGVRVAKFMADVGGWPVNRCEQARQAHLFQDFYQLGKGFWIEHCRTCGLTRAEVKALQQDNNSSRKDGTT